MLCGRGAELEVAVGRPVGAERGRSAALVVRGEPASGRPRSWLMSFDRSWPSDRT